VDKHRNNNSYSDVDKILRTKVSMTFERTWTIKGEKWENMSDKRGKVEKVEEETWR